jgi:hypothetical protein
MNKNIIFGIILLVSTVSYAQPNIGIEFSFLGTNSNVIIPGLFSSTFDEVESGNGSDIGLGIDIGINEKLIIDFQADEKNASVANQLGNDITSMVKSKIKSL